MLIDTLLTLTRNPTSLLLQHLPLLQRLTPPLLLLLLLTRIILRTAFTRTGMPSPPRYPFLGTFLSTLSYLKKNQMHKFFEENLERYGPFVEVGFASFPIVSVADPVEAKRVCCSEDFVRSPKLQRASKDLMQSALFMMLTNDTWRKHRKGLQPAFGPHHLRQTSDLANHFTADMSASWIRFAQKEENEAGVVLDLKEYFSAITLDIIGRIAFSHDFNALGSIGTVLPEGEIENREAFEVLVEAGIKRIVIPPVFWGLVGVSGEQLRRYREHVHKIARGCLEARKEGKVEELKRRKVEGEVVKFSDQEILDEVIAFMMAGHETSANTLTFIFLLLAQHPEVADKVYEEIQSLLGPGEDPKMEDLPKFKYLDNVFKESQRFYPVVPTFLRETVRDTTIGGYKVPRGVTVQVNLGAMMRSPLYWGPTAKTFDPSRWDSLPDTAEHAFLPFGWGGHMCIGLKMAMVEIKTIMIGLVRRFEFSMEEEDGQQQQQDLRTLDGITVHLRQLKVKVKVREGGVGLN
ncbi:hypothetical protein HDV05_007844 [Chytridiales sp. JEL 0842]|nr:hypothetical protein HDV05_007844 [Chytridiales sp. JEL 0842]